MFNSCLFDVVKEMDDGQLDLSNPIVKAVYDEHVELLDFFISLWLDDDESDKGFIEHFSRLFPAGFISRDIQRARQIIFDLKNIAESTIIRNELAPIYIYVMHYLINEWCDYINDCEDIKRKIPQDVENYLLRKKKKKNSEEYRMISSWFVDEKAKSIDFIETYDGDFAFQDEIESIATVFLEHEYGKEELENLDVNIQDYMDLMPNDLYVRVKEKYLSEKEKHKTNREKEVIQTLDIHKEIVNACIKLSDNSISTCGLDEDGLNRYIRDNLQSSLHHFQFSVLDQTQQGYSGKGKGPGELDIRIIHNNMPTINCECLIHKSKQYLYDHIDKAIKNYNPIGCKNTYIICYSKGQNYNLFWNTFREWVNSFDIVYDWMEPDTSEYAGIRQAKGKYKCLGEEGVIHYIGVNIMPCPDSNVKMEIQTKRIPK